MDKIKKAAVSTKRFVGAHRVAITFTLTAALCLKINYMALKDHNDFLKKHGLYDAFYTLEEEKV